MHSVSIRVSAGELIDRISILELKAARIPGDERQRNIRKELAALLENLTQFRLNDIEYSPLFEGLRRVNCELWEIEDSLRECERRQEFGPQFVELARLVYLKNDKRAELKRRINELSGSDIKEEKSYASYEVAPRV